MVTLKIEENSTPEMVQVIRNGLDGYNFRFVQAYNFQGLNIFAFQESGELAGGLLGETFWGWLHIDILWVDEPARGQGAGKAMVEAAEAEAVARGCAFAQVETHDFQALPFYQKQGYSVFGELEDFPAGHTKYYLKKKIEGKS